MNARNRHSSERSCAAALPEIMALAATSGAAAVTTNGFILRLVSMVNFLPACRSGHRAMKPRTFSFCHSAIAESEKRAEPPRLRPLTRRVPLCGTMRDHIDPKGGANARHRRICEDHTDRGHPRDAAHLSE